MSVMSVRVDDDKRKTLKIIASMEDKTISSLIGNLIDEYIQKKKKNLKRQIGQDELESLMKLSEVSFAEWDNEEDEIYNNL